MAARGVHVKHDYFSTQSQAYRSFRPSYPPQLFERLASSLSGPKTLAVDVGCGNGQATVKLADYFDRVIGVEPSAGQLENAEKHDRVEYRAGKAEDLSFLPDKSVDLVTVAQALHWFDLPVFFKEVKRVLRSEGVFATWGYDLSTFDSPEANRLLNKFYNETLDGCWSEKRKLVDEHYRSIDFPFSSVKREIVEMEKRMPVEAYLNYLTTWSSYQKYLETKHKEGEEDIIEAFGRELMQAVDKKLEDEIAVHWPIFLITGKDEE